MLLMHLVGLTGAGVNLVNPLTIGASYQVDETTAPPANAQLTITFKRDGTWTITVGTGDTLTGTPSSGNWAAAPSATVGDNATIQYSTANLVNSPVVNNGASSPTTISADRTISVAKNSALASADVTCTVVWGSETVADTASITADGT